MPAWGDAGVRGEDHLTNTPRQLLILGLGLAAPATAAPSIRGDLSRKYIISRFNTKRFSCFVVQGRRNA